MGFWRKWGLSILMLLVILGTFSYGIFKRRQWKQDHVLVEVRAIEVPNGWGYDILRDGRPFFHQNIIPGLSGNRVFQSKEDALAVGQVIYNRILAGQTPSITEKEMREMHIFIPPDTSHVADSTRYADSIRASRLPKVTGPSKVK